MSKKLFLFFIKVSIVFSVFSQKDTIRYSVVKDDPYDIPKMYIMLNPVAFHLGSSLYIGAQLNLIANISNKININAIGAIQYPKADITSSELFNRSNNAVEFDYKKIYEKSAEIGVGYVVSDKSRTEDMPIVVHANQARSGNVTVITSNYVMAKAQHRRVIRLRAGGIVNQTNFSLGKKETIVTTNGVIFNDQQYTDDIFTPSNVVFPDINYGALTGSSVNLFSDINGQAIITQTTIGGYIGISSNHICNLILDVNDYGIRGITKVSTFYADIIFGKSTLSNFEFYNSNPTATDYGDEIGKILTDYEIDFDKSTVPKANPIGFRLGYMRNVPLLSKGSSFENRIKKVEKLAYYSYYIETGIMPSYGATRGLFFKMGIGININPF